MVTLEGFKQVSSMIRSCDFLFSFFLVGGFLFLFLLVQRMAFRVYISCCTI